MKIIVFLVFASVLFGCNKETGSSITDHDTDTDITADQEFVSDTDDFLIEPIEMDDETFEVDDETFEVDDETEPDDDSSDEVLTELDDETFEVDDETSDEVDDADAVEVPLDGFGIITGACGVLDDELGSENSFFLLNRIDFMTDPYDEVDYAFLTEGGQEILDDVNTGNSVYSKVFAYEVLARCEFAGLLKTENEIEYGPDTETTDFLVSIDGLKIGVSVTKAVKFPFDSEYTVEDAETLLNKKLSDIIASSQNVLPEDKWEKQILHIIAYSDSHALSIETAYNSLDESTKADTIVFVTVSEGDDSFLY